MSDRYAQILRMLDTRDDNLPTPTRRSHTTPGFAQGIRVRLSCEDCLANGKRMPGCESCGGRGYVEEWRSRDPYAVSETVQPYGLDPARHDRTRDRDAEIERLQEQTRPPRETAADELEDANRHPYGWETARRRMYAAFDYAALDRALDQFHKSQPGVSPYSDPGLAFIDARMPDPIRAPGDVAELPARPVVQAVSRQTRDAKIAELDAAGVDVAVIAMEVRTSIRTVYRALNNLREAA